MATGGMRPIGIGAVGLVLAVTGLVFLSAGHTAVGISNLGFGLVFFIVGLAVARKSAAPRDGTGSPPGNGGEGE